VDSLANVEGSAGRLAQLQDVPKVELEPATVEQVDPAGTDWFSENPFDGAGVTKFL
jgi:hypothetical protein